MTRITRCLTAAALVATVALPLEVAGQGHVHGTAPAGAPPPAAPVRITMEGLHAAGGVPPGWRFTLPAGDAAAGRGVFVDLKCFACHAVQGEQFPLKPGESASAGPDLTGMGSHHPAEYLAESIVNPSAVLVEGPGYIGADGRSVMPPTPQMTLGQLVDLVAYLRSLTGDGGHHASPAAQEKSAGPYRVRLVYRAAPADEHAHHHGHAGHGAAAPPGDSLMVFVSAADSGQPVPYLPVTARIDAPGQTPRRIKLTPALGPEGLYYGAAVAPVAQPRRIVVSIGAPAGLRVLPGAASGLGRAQDVSFDLAPGS